MPEYHTDKETGHKKLTGNVFDKHGNPVPPNKFHWLGKYSDIPHILSFMCHNYSDIIYILETVPEIYPLITPLVSCWRNKDMELFELFTMPLRTMLSKFCTPEAYWIFHRDGDDFDLRRNENYLIINCREGYEKVMNMISVLVTGKVPEQKIQELNSKRPWYDTLVGNLTATVYDFKPAANTERILLENMENVRKDVDTLILDIQNGYKKISI